MNDRIDSRLAAAFAAWRANDAAGAASQFCEDGIFQEAHKPPILGREAIAAHFERFFARAGHGWSIAVEASLVEGPAAALAYRFSMAEVDGQSVERAGCAIVEFCGSRIHRWREYEG